MKIQNQDPKIAELASRVLSVMWMDRVGVITAATKVVTETQDYCRVLEVKNAVVRFIDENVELKQAIVEQLRSCFPTHAARTAEEIARAEDAAPVISAPTEQGQMSLF